MTIFALHDEVCPVFVFYDCCGLWVLDFQTQAYAVDAQTFQVHELNSTMAHFSQKRVSIHGSLVFGTHCARCTPLPVADSETRWFGYPCLLNKRGTSQITTNCPSTRQRFTSKKRLTVTRKGSIKAMPKFQHHSAKRVSLKMWSQVATSTQTNSTVAFFCD